MKKLIFASTVQLLFISTNIFSQAQIASITQYSSKLTNSENLRPYSRNLNFDVYGKHNRPVKKEKLREASRIEEVIPGYPSSWIKEYISVEISTVGNGKVLKALSSGSLLTSEQKNLLRAVDLGTDIVVNVNYKFENAEANRIENRTMHTVLSIIPEREAEYIGGRQRMRRYLNETCVNKIYENYTIQFERAAVRFTINEKGEVSNSVMSQKSGNADIDQLLLDAINNMPQWKPAETSTGEKVKQEFEFSIGMGGC
jgi:TonB family protein